MQDAEEYNKSLPVGVRLPKYEIIYHSKLINTKEIAQLFQKSEEQALELEIKKLSKEINQPLTGELKELISNFIQARKMIKNGSEEARDKALKLEDQLLEEKDLPQEKVDKIISYCKRFVDLEQQVVMDTDEPNTQGESSTGMTRQLKRKLILSAEDEDKEKTKETKLEEQAEPMEIDDNQEQLKAKVEIPTNKIT